MAADFDGGMVSSDAGALLPGETDKAIGLTDRFAACFGDRRNPLLTVHPLKALVAQRVFGLALGYEDLNDHDELRGDPVLGVLLGQFERAAEAPSPLAGKSTLNRLEHAPGAGKAPRYHKIGHDGAAIEKLFVDLFLEAHQKAPRQIVLDLDATDDPLHGDQEGGFFHGYYDCCCHLPLYVFCGRRLLAAKLRRSNIDGSAGAVEEMDRNVAQIRERWPKVKIVPARRFRLCARGLDGVVRGQRGRLRFRSRPQWTAGGAHRRRVGRGAAPVAGERRPAGAGVSRIRLVDQGQLVAPAAGDRQGRMDRRRSQADRPPFQAADGRACP